MQSSTKAMTPTTDEHHWRARLRQLAGVSPFWFGVTLSVVLLVLNVPGQYVYEVDPFESGKYGPHFESLDRHVEHGAPWTYLRRDATVLISTSGRTSGWPTWWNIWNNSRTFYPAALVADGLVAATAVWVGLRVLRWRYAQRLRWWQLSLGDMVFGMTVFAAVVGYVCWVRSEYLREQRIIARLETLAAEKEESTVVLITVETVPGGPTFLREVFGDSALRWFDRVAIIEADAAHLSDVVQLRHLKAVRLHGDMDPERGISELLKCETLEGIDFLWLGYARGTLRIPYLPTVRVVNLYENEVDPRDLLNLPNVEHLELGHTNISEADVPILCQLKRLKVLSLPFTPSPEAAAQLRRALPECDFGPFPEVFMPGP
jgi:hypothetical protein